MDADKPSLENQQAWDWALAERIGWFPVPDEEDLDSRVAELVAKPNHGPSGKKGG